MLDCFLESYRETEAKKITNEDLDNLSNSIEQIFIFALTWSFGCTGDYQSRLKFDKNLREISNVFPEEGLVYDYYFDTEDFKFVPWVEQFKDFEVENNLQYHEIMIPNIDSTRNT